MHPPAPIVGVRDRLIIALDLPDETKALNLVSSLSGAVTTFKIGLQLYTRGGPDIVRRVVDTGAKIFLDLKLHDIPNTVAKAVEAAAKLNVQMLTLHLSGGRAMVEAAVKSKPSHLMLLGVTVLTSSTEETLHETGVTSAVNEQVARLAVLGVSSGIDGLITSPHEVNSLRKQFDHRVTLVTPGVRPTWSEPNDQRRFTTPREALQNGADYLVVGRPITAAIDPRAAMERLVQEISD